MTGSRNIPHSYAGAEAMLVGQCKYRRKVGCNTYVVRHSYGDAGNTPLAEEELFLQLHGHGIAKYLPDGGIRLHDCGWHTLTTKDRLNQAISPLWLIQRDYSWYVWNPVTKATVPFHNGMVVYPQA